jgi:capsular polysaccharide biosynthesis protein
MIVEIDEVAARVIRSYWLLLLVMLVVPVLLVGMVMKGKAPAYMAQTRLDASSKVTDAAPGDAGVSVVVSQVKAFATSYNVLSRVIRDQHINRQPLKVAKKIQVNGLGTSTVVELTVSDPDPAVARKLTDALGVAVVGEINKSNQGSLNAQIASIDKQIAKAQKRLGTVNRTVVNNPFNVAAANEKDRLSSEIADLRTDRTTLRGELVSAGRAAVVQPAVLQPRQDPAVMMSVLAGLVGLIGGILIAVLLEILRPTVPGAHRVARRLGVPLLGKIDRGAAQLSDTGRRIRLAAKRENLTQVALVSTGRGPVPVDLVSKVAAAVYGDSSTVIRPPTIAGLDDAQISPDADDDAIATDQGRYGADGEDPTAGTSSNGDGRSHTPVKPGTTIIRTGTALMVKRSQRVEAVAEQAAARAICHVHAFEDIDPGADTETVGVVAVAGPVTRLSALQSVRDLVAASGWPLLGVVATSRKIRG